MLNAFSEFNSLTTYFYVLIFPCTELEFNVYNQQIKQISCSTREVPYTISILQYHFN